MNVSFENRPSSDPGAQLAEYEIFLAAGYIAENRLHRVTAYDRYPCADFVVARMDQHIIGVSRIIWNDPSGDPYNFPMLNDFPDIDSRVIQEIRSYAPEQLAECATIGVKPAYRGRRRILVDLVEHSLLRCYERGVVLALASIDANVVKLLSAVGFPPEPVGEAQFYMGSMTIPTVYRFTHFRGGRLEFARRFGLSRTS